ncbi:MAG: hypothetical protein Fur0046_34320 [Cyanobacteria bacterium J069]
MSIVNKLLLLPWNAPAVLKGLVANDPISKDTMRATGIVLVFVGGLLLLLLWDQAQASTARRGRAFWQELLLGSAFAAMGAGLILWGSLR